MAVYSVEGKLGTGKTKFCVWRARDALLEGRRVASNVDLRLDQLVPSIAARYVRIPDKPRSWDLEAIGHGNPDSYDEDRNGVLILDELGTWLNSRSFGDKDRSSVIDWLIHARKRGWDVFLIVQDAGMIDKQVREALIEYQCRCVRLDRVKIPVAGRVVTLAGDLVSAVSWRLAQRWKVARWGYLPRMHVVSARVGYGTGQVVAERWMFRGDELHGAYDTRQVFRADYPHGAHSVIWRPSPPAPGWLARLRSRLFAAPRAPVLKPKLPQLVALGGLPPDEAWRVAARYVRALDPQRS